MNLLIDGKRQNNAGDGTLPVVAPTLFEPLEAQLVEAVSRTRPLRSIT